MAVEHHKSDIVFARLHPGSHTAEVDEAGRGADTSPSETYGIERRYRGLAGGGEVYELGKPLRHQRLIVVSDVEQIDTGLGLHIDACRYALAELNEREAVHVEVRRREPPHRATARSYHYIVVDIVGVRVDGYGRVYAAVGYLAALRHLECEYVMLSGLYSGDGLAHLVNSPLLVDEIQLPCQRARILEIAGTYLLLRESKRSLIAVILNDSLIIAERLGDAMVETHAHLYVGYAANEINRRNLTGPYLERLAPYQIRTLPIVDILAVGGHRRVDAVIELYDVGHIIAVFERHHRIALLIEDLHTISVRIGGVRDTFHYGYIRSDTLYIQPAFVTHRMHRRIIGTRGAPHAHQRGDQKRHTASYIVERSHYDTLFVNNPKP